MADSGSNYFDNAPLGKDQKKFLWFAAIAYFFDQMDLFTYSLVAPKLMEISTWKLTMDQNGMINFMTFFGMFVGSLFAGWLSDRLGRKKGMLIMMTTFSLASIANGLANSYEMFLVTRFVTGFGVIGMVVNSMVYMAEMLPSATRGKYQALTLVVGSLGVPFCAMFAKIVVPLGENSWRLVFVLGGLSILLVPLGMLWLKESPRWLVSKGRISDAENILTQIIPGRKINLAIAAEGQPKMAVSAALKLLFNKVYLKRTIVLLLLAVGTTVGGFILNSFFPVLVKEFGFSMNLVMTITIIATLAVPSSDVLASFVTDRGGRKIPIIIWTSMAALFTVIMAVFPTAMGLSVNAFLRVLFGSGALTMVWSYLAESYPTEIRTSAAGIIFGSARLSAALAMLAVPPIFAAFGSKGVILFSAIAYGMPSLVVLFLGEKTSKKSLEELNIVGERLLHKK